MWTYRCPPAASAAEPTPPKPLSAIPTQHPIGTIVQPPVSMASQKRQIPKTTTPKPEPTKQESVQPPAGSNAIKRKSVLGPAVIYLVGLAGGMFACQTLPQLAPFLTLYSQNLEQVQAGTGADMLFSLGFLGHIGVLLALFLCGLCAIGTPLIGLVFLLRGMWESAYLASFFAQSSWQGVLLYTIVFWLPGLIFLGFQLQFGADALQISRRIRKSCLQTGVLSSLQPGVKRFQLRFLTFGALGAFAALLQTAFFLFFRGSLI